MDAIDELQRGRDAFDGHSWSTAEEALESADLETPLSAADLELLATAAYMRGHDDVYVEVLQRAHRTHLDAGDQARAARCAIWCGMQHFMHGSAGAASGWFGRAQRLIEAVGECAEGSFIRVPEVFALEAHGEYGEAATIAAAVLDGARRHGDRDLAALAGQMHGRLLVRDGDVATGLAELDEAMVAVTSGELSPIARGIVYCGVIAGCSDAFEVRRAQEWTAALTRWCEAQEDLVAFTGSCMVHRAELMQRRGAWPDALAEARRACARCEELHEPRSAARAAYLQAEVHRLRGRHGEAEASYIDASRGGYEPQPGLALLRLVQGDAHAALSALRRALTETADRPTRTALLPAMVEVSLAAGDIEAARSASAELQELAVGHPSPLPVALADQCRGAVDLASGEAAGALPALRAAWRGWQEVGAPYDAARARELVAEACRLLGDGDAAAMELDAARDAYAALGARPDAERVARMQRFAPRSGDGRNRQVLTPREMQVLKMVAEGSTNRAIASVLVLSEKTVDRHVSNILAKLRVPSRAAATAFAYEHELL